MKITFTPIPGDTTIMARLEPDGLVINGKLHPWDAAPEVVEYGEQAGVSLINLQLDHTYQVIPSSWVDPNPPKAPEPDLAAELEAARASWSVDRWQIKAVLGKANWEKVVEFGNAQDAPWGLQVVIEDAQKIPRLSETVELLAWLLGMDAEQVDALFLAAMALRA